MSSPYGSHGDVYRVQVHPPRPVRSKTAAVLFALLLGTLGVHSFYLGRPALGLGHLALAVSGPVLVVLGILTGGAGGVDAGSALPLGLGALLWAANGAWALVDLVVILVTPEPELGR